MRINNPKSIVGFQRTETSDELAYNLATVGQVKTAIKELQDTVINILTGFGKGGFGGGGIGEQLTPNFGYAWLNSEGKVDVNLLPALAITETHVAKQSELKAIQALPTTTTSPDQPLNFNNILNIWLRNQVLAGKTFQAGDIIIVSTELGETPDPVYAGSYIITLVPETNTSGEYQLSKLAYTDGNIVKINGVAPRNSAGEIRLYLSDILKERYIDKFVTAASGAVDAANATAALEDSVYRLVTLDEGAEGYRFAFIDNSDTGQGAVIPYTKFAEFNAEKASTAERFTAVNDAITALTQKHDEELAALEEKHDNETAFISGTVGKRTDAANSDQETASVFALTKALRNDVDAHYTAYQTTEGLTNDMLSMIHQNVKNLHQGLEKRAVRLYMQPIIWKEADANVVQFDLTSPQYKYQVSSSDVSGVVHWTYTHSPIRVGTNDVDDPSENLGQGISNELSQERVLAVYDENGTLVNVDIELVKNVTTGLTDTIIKIDTEFIGRGEDTKLKNSLDGKEWTLLIGKTISGIDLTDALVNV